MWEVPLSTQQSEVVENNIMYQTTNQELAQYLHAALFRPTVFKEIKPGLLNSWKVPIENIIKKHI